VKYPITLLKAVTSLMLTLGSGCALIDSAKDTLLNVVENPEKKGFMDACVQNTRLSVSAKESKVFCDCAWRKYNDDGLSGGDAGLQCVDDVNKSSNTKR